MTTFVARITVDSRGTRHDFGGKIMAGIIKVTKDIQENDAKRKAVVLSNTISHKYDKYLTNNSYLLDVDEDQRINVVLYERKSGGYGVRVQGTNVLYYEYGTGTRGDMNKHPKKPDRLKGYGTGKYILQHGEYKNNHSDNKPPSPQWYPFDKNGNIKKQNYKMATARTDSALGGVKNIKFSDMVWKHAGVITLGAPAGKFIYESVELFKKNFGEEAGMITYKKSISVRIKNSIQNELKR